MVADKVCPSRNFSSPSIRCFILLSVSSTLIVGMGWSEACSKTVSKVSKFSTKKFQKKIHVSVNSTRFITKEEED
jgi:hypothetical protein